MIDASITFYPVGNGDTTLIRLTDGWAIMIDCNIRANNGDEQHYDVHEHLFHNHVNTDDGNIPFINAFILTHPDQDHSRGFRSAFYTGPPSEYSEEDKNNELILINELWTTPRPFSDLEGDLSEDAEVFRDEAERRMELHKSGDERRNDPGNRLRIIGSTDSDDLQDLKDIVLYPGNEVDEIDGDTKNDFRFFIHAPFKADIDSDDGERNNTSIVLQARFTVDGVADACLAILGGDANYRVWERIVKESDDDTLAWDLLLAPHHCSWTFFSESGVSEPNEESKTLLEKGREGARVIASCKPFKRGEVPPPSFEARKEYIEIVGKEQFLVTSETLSEDDSEPIVFVMAANGPRPDDSSSTENAAAGVAAINVLRSRPTYG